VEAGTGSAVPAVGLSDVGNFPGTVSRMTVFSPEFSQLLRRMARRSFPFAALFALVAVGLLTWSVVRHSARMRRGEISERPRRTRIAPLP